MKFKHKFNSIKKHYQNKLKNIAQLYIASYNLSIQIVMRQMSKLTNKQQTKINF